MKQTSFTMGDGDTMKLKVSDKFPQLPPDVSPIFSYDIDSDKQKYNFVGTIGGGEFYDVLIHGWIEDGKQHYKGRVRFEQSGDKYVVELETLEDAIKMMKELAQAGKRAAAEIQAAFGVNIQIDEPRFYHGRRARQFVKRMIDAGMKAAGVTKQELERLAM